ncbi:MAG: adventurous gliding motility protein S [Bdellovibrio sp.]|nr:MAG: adventurous gliding motility protein S [Bdellovibrio sp.]
MAIHRPGEKFRNHYLLSRHGSKRGLVMVMNLTAMVDMFTVLVIFLLQNYNSTGEIIFIPKEIVLPKAEHIKELKPSVVVTLSEKELLYDRNPVMTLEQLKAQEDWEIPALDTLVKKGLKEAKEKYESRLQTRLKSVVAKGEKEEKEPWNKVTVQADKGIDFLSVKKVMYTVTEAGAGEINFAVMKQLDKK